MGIELAAVSIGASVLGAGASFLGSSKAAEAQRAAEKARHEQMMFEARRKELEALRIGQRAHAMALYNSTNQGAQQGSGYQGGVAQATAQTNVNLEGIYGNLQYGNALFDANMQASQWMTVAQAGQGLSSLGQNLTQNAPAFSRLTNTFFPQPNYYAQNPTSYSGRGGIY